MNQNQSNNDSLQGAGSIFEEQKLQIHRIQQQFSYQFWTILEQRRENKMTHLSEGLPSEWCASKLPPSVKAVIEVSDWDRESWELMTSDYPPFLFVSLSLYLSCCSALNLGYFKMDEVSYPCQSCIDTCILSDTYHESIWRLNLFFPDTYQDSIR